jgi:hypothetical protein
MKTKYTGEKAQHRKERQAERQRHIEAVERSEVSEELPDILVPAIFSDIQETYWKCLESVSDPRNPDKRVYPLSLILHRVISGFIGGNTYIGVMFPTKRTRMEAGKKKLGAMPTRKAVYTLLRRIDWAAANAVLAPLWERLGYRPSLVVRREFRNPGEIPAEFRKEQEVAEKERKERISGDQEAAERAKGMSAAKAKMPGSAKPVEKEMQKEPQPPVGLEDRVPVAVRHDLVIDGKVVKASYNAGVRERVVLMTEIKKDACDNRSRFIIGSYPTELDRNGEWGAALSVLEALTPLPGDRVVLVSGDAGFCVEEFCRWLNEKNFFLHLPDKGKCR